MKGIFLYLLLLSGFSVYCQEEQPKDSLFFKYDDNYIYESPHEEDVYYLKNLGDAGKSGSFELKKIKVYDDLKKNNIFCIKDYVQQSPSKFYNKRKNNLDEYYLWEHLIKFVVFFVCEKNGKVEYMEVDPIYAIE